MKLNAAMLLAADDFKTIKKGAAVPKNILPCTAGHRSELTRGDQLCLFANSDNLWLNFKMLFPDVLFRLISKKMCLIFPEAICGVWVE